MSAMANPLIEYNGQLCMPCMSVHPAGSQSAAMFALGLFELLEGLVGRMCVSLTHGRLHLW